MGNFSEENRFTPPYPYYKLWRIPLHSTFHSGPVGLPDCTINRNILRLFELGRVLKEQHIWQQCSLEETRGCLPWKTHDLAENVIKTNWFRLKYQMFSRGSHFKIILFSLICNTKNFQKIFSLIFQKNNIILAFGNIESSYRVFLKKQKTACTPFRSDKQSHFEWSQGLKWASPPFFRQKTTPRVSRKISTFCNFYSTF